MKWASSSLEIKMSLKPQTVIFRVFFESLFLGNQVSYVVQFTSSIWKKFKSSQRFLVVQFKWTINTILLGLQYLNESFTRLFDSILMRPLGDWFSL